MFWAPCDIISYVIYFVEKKNEIKMPHDFSVQVLLNLVHQICAECAEGRITAKLQEPSYSPLLACANHLKLQTIIFLQITFPSRHAVRVCDILE